jgi:protein-S-isoprenylcysteine O-methyltransferase Ste14
VVGYLGLSLLILGFLQAAVAVRQMGVSWRIGIDKEAPGPLVSRGLFSRVRHPIYSGVLLATAGLAALTADLFSLTVAAAAWIGIPVQARLEEEFLLSRYPEYATYLEHTGRFWPRIISRR